MTGSQHALNGHITQALDTRQEQLIVSITRLLEAMSPADRVLLFAQLNPKGSVPNNQWLINTAAVLGFSIAQSIAETAKDKLREHVKGN